MGLLTAGSSMAKQALVHSAWDVDTAVEALLSGATF